MYYGNLISPVLKYTLIMENGKDPGRVGKDAEQRVFAIASRLTPKVKMADKKEDCGGGKTDIFIEGVPVQISAQPKSRAQRRALNRKGVVNIAAGTDFSDDQILNQILGLFNN